MVSITNMIFDIFVTEIITTLLNGLTVYIANYNEQRELSSFEKLITSNEIEILQTTPGIFAIQNQNFPGNRQCNS